jgi:glutathione reductase (NADPH)
MSYGYDLLVIGAGMAGVSAANKAAAQGWRVAITDRLPYGGTCALRGCDPKKILRRGAEIIDAAGLLRGKGIAQDGLAIDWQALMAHKRGFTDPVPDNLDKSLAAAGVDTFHDSVRFTGAHSVDIGGREQTSRHFLIATGARPRLLDVPGHELMIDSTAFLDLEQLPPRIVFVGGGFVSFEFAHIAARAGCQVTILDRGARPLKQFDPDLVELLVERGGEVGIDVRRKSEITSVEHSGSGYRIHLLQDGQPTTLEAGLVVHGAGRVPALADLDLDSGEIAHGEHGVAVAPHLQSTTNAGVYAAGDAADTGGMPLTPVAVFEGKVAASNMLKDTRTVPDYSGVPTAVFSIPELVRIGMSEQEAHGGGHDVDVRYNDTGGWYSNYRVGEHTAATKILVDRETDLILGAHLLGPEYAELANTIGMAMKLGVTTRQLKSATATYPSVGSDLGSML